MRAGTDSDLGFRLGIRTSDGAEETLLLLLLLLLLEELPPPQAAPPPPGRLKCATMLPQLLAADCTGDGAREEVGDTALAAASMLRWIAACVSSARCFARFRNSGVSTKLPLSGM